MGKLLFPAHSRSFLPVYGGPGVRGSCFACFWSFRPLIAPLPRAVVQECAGMETPHAMARYGPIWPDLPLAVGSERGAPLPLAETTGCLRRNDACNQCRGWSGNGAMGCCRGVVRGAPRVRRSCVGGGTQWSRYGCVSARLLPVPAVNVPVLSRRIHTRPGRTIGVALVPLGQCRWHSYRIRRLWEVGIPSLRTAPSASFHQALLHPQAHL